MLPITLPKLSNQNYAKLPPSPSNPPSQTDIALAKVLQSEIMTHHLRKEVPEKDVYEVALYNAKLMATQLDAAGGIEPPWFTQTMNGLREDIRKFQDDMTNIKGGMADAKRDIEEIKGGMADAKRDIEEIKNDVKQMKMSQGKTQRVAALAHNNRLGTGENVKYETVPFPNGVDPTMPPHNLPALSSPRGIRSLTEDERDVYLKEYYPNRAFTRQTTAEQRIRLIFDAVGSRS